MSYVKQLLSVEECSQKLATKKLEDYLSSCVTFFYKNGINYRNSWFDEHTIKKCVSNLDDPNKFLRLIKGSRRKKRESISHLLNYVEDKKAFSTLIDNAKIYLNKFKLCKLSQNQLLKINQETNQSLFKKQELIIKRRPLNSFRDDYCEPFGEDTPLVEEFFKQDIFLYYCSKSLINLITGEWTEHSCFYDAENKTVNYKALKERLKTSPEKQYLFFVNFHF